MNSALAYLLSYLKTFLLLKFTSVWCRLLNSLQLLFSREKFIDQKLEKKCICTYYSDAVCGDWLESSTLLFLVAAAFTFLDQYFGGWYHTHTYTCWFFLACLWKKNEEAAESFQTFLFPRRASFVVLSSWKFQKDPPIYGLKVGKKGTCTFKCNYFIALPMFRPGRTVGFFKCGCL